MFKFKLQPVLDQRKAVEELRQREYHEALRQLTGLEEKRSEVLRQHDEAREQVVRSIGTRHGGALRQYFADWSRWVSREIRRMEGEIGSLRAQAERRREALVEAVKQRTMIEKLREREEREWRTEEARAEQKTFDELALREYAGRRREEKSSS